MSIEKEIVSQLEKIDWKRIFKKFIKKMYYIISDEDFGSKKTFKEFFEDGNQTGARNTMVFSIFFDNFVQNILEKHGFEYPKNHIASGYDLLYKNNKIELKMTRNLSGWVGHKYSKKTDFHLLFCYNIDEILRRIEFAVYFVDVNKCTSIWESTGTHKVSGFSSLKFKSTDIKNINCILGGFNINPVWLKSHPKYIGEY